MAKKIIINENWEEEVIDDLDNLFVVIFQCPSDNCGYIEAFDTDDELMKGAYNNLINQYNDCGCSEDTKIYLVKVPNTEQTNELCNCALYDGNTCKPDALEAIANLNLYPDYEQVYCWQGNALTEARKKKVCSSITYTTGYPALNIQHFNKCMGTNGLGDPADHPHLVVGDTLPNGPVADAGSSDGASDAGSSAGEGGAMGESLVKESYIIRLPDEDGELHNEVFDSKKAAHDYLDDLYINYHDTDFAEENLYPLLCQIEDDEWEEDDNGNFIVESLKNRLTEDTTKELQIQNNENIEEDNEELNPPIDLDYFPNTMGINLSSVKSEKWTEQDDGQLKKVEIEFDPAKEVEESLNLQEAKRYVKRYYVRPQNIFCSNKEDILKALLRVGDENCSIYSLKDLPDHDDVQLLKPSDIIYYYDDGILYDKNHVKVMDYDLNVKHEEERKKFANVDTAPDAQVNNEYEDRLTDADLKDKEAVANFKAINQRQLK